MTGEGKLSPQLAAQRVIYRALRNSVQDTGLRVQRPPGLAGAYIAGPQVHAYVIAKGDRYQVDLWRHHDPDPYRSATFADLDAAVHAASTAAAPP